MLHFLRRHPSLAVLLFGAVILSFVVFMAPSSRTGFGGSSNPVVGTLYGRSIQLEEYRQALKESRLNFLLRYGEWPNNSQRARQMGYDSEREALNRLLVIEKQRQLGIQIPDEALIAWIREHPLFQGDGENPSFDKGRYEFFMTNVFPRGNVSRADFHEYARHEIGMQELSSLVGLPGELVTPLEAKENVREEFRKAQTEMVVFSLSNHVDQINLTDTDIEEYYRNNQALYRVPERLRVSYVEFAFTNYLAEADQTLATNANLEVQIDQVYANRGKEAFRDEEGQIMPEDEAREQIRGELRDEVAHLIAKRKANEFATVVIESSDNEENPGAAFFEQKARELGLEPHLTAPFSRFQSPPGLKVGRDFSQTAFQLGQEEPYSLPLEGEEAFYVLAIQERIPSSVQPLEEVRDRVVTQLRQDRLRELTREAGEAFYVTLTNQMAAGKGFQEIVEAAGKEVVPVPPFSLRDTSITGYSSGETGVSLTDLKNAAFSLSPGEVSQYLSSRQNGFILHLIQMLPISDLRVDDEYPEVMADMRTQRRIAAFNDWFQSALENAHSTLPVSSTEPTAESSPQ